MKFTVPNATSRNGLENILTNIALDSFESNQTRERKSKEVYLWLNAAFKYKYRNLFILKILMKEKLSSSLYL